MAFLFLVFCQLGPISPIPTPADPVFAKLVVADLKPLLQNIRLIQINHGQSGCRHKYLWAPEASTVLDVV
ncbi:hypothetical protein PG984_008764 [Apiospora sp. TS-2023a]